MNRIILVLNGPNLNMLGMREPEVYGTQTLDDIKALCIKAGQDADMDVDFRQSNHEGDLVDWIQEAAIKQFAGVVINAGAYTHTSVAIHDALRLLKCPIAEVHLSDPKTREAFRHLSYIEPLAFISVVGKGAEGYTDALTAISKKLCN